MGEMKILENRYGKILTISTFAILVVSFGSIAFGARALPENLVLGFSSASGITSFGNPQEVWGIWIMGVVFTIVNLVLGDALMRQNRALAYGFAVLNLLISILILTAIGTIMSVN